jgi:uncharacterized membrane protein YdjX (TVP38/TMEM64 family)
MRRNSGQNIFELLLLLLLFWVGFIPGHYIAMREGVVQGGICGFLICWAAAVTYSIIRNELISKLTRRNKRTPPAHGQEESQ